MLAPISVLTWLAGSRAGRELLTARQTGSRRGEKPFRPCPRALPLPTRPHLTASQLCLPIVQSPFKSPPLSARGFGGRTDISHNIGEAWRSGVPAATWAFFAQVLCPFLPRQCCHYRLCLLLSLTPQPHFFLFQQLPEIATQVLSIFNSDNSLLRSLLLAELGLSPPLAHPGAQ